MLQKLIGLPGAKFEKRKMALLAKIQDEAGHGLYLYAARKL